MDIYLSEVSPARAPQVLELREIARRVLADHEEQMLWGRPAYLRDGRAVFGFAEQKQYVSLYFGSPEVLDRHAAVLAPLRHSKGCLRYRRSAPVDWDLVERLLVELRELAPA